MPKKSSNTDFWKSIERDDDRFKKKHIKLDKSDVILEQTEQIQAQRVISVMDEIIRKTRIAICLHELFCHRVALVKSILNSSDWDYIRTNYDLGETGSFSVVDLNAAIFNKEEYAFFMLCDREKPKVSPTMLRVIHMLSKYSKIEEIVSILIEKNKTRQSATWLYLQTLEELRRRIVDEIQTPAEKEIKKYHHLRRLYITQSAFAQRLNGLRGQLSDERKKLNSKMERNQQTKFMGSLRPPSLEKENKEKLSQHIRYSECEMALRSKEHEEKLVTLLSMRKQAIAAYEDTVEENLTTENKIKTRRIKLELHLSGFIKQYDKEIGGRQEVLDEITTAIENYEKKIADQWEEYHRIEKDYEECLAERERLYQAEMTKKAMQFNRERCVRVIQTAWRKILEIRHLKEKRKSPGKVLNMAFNSKPNNNSSTLFR